MTWKILIVFVSVRPSSTATAVSHSLLKYIEKNLLTELNYKKCAYNCNQIVTSNYYRRALASRKPYLIRLCCVYYSFIWYTICTTLESHERISVKVENLICSNLAVILPFIMRHHHHRHLVVSRLLDNTRLN